MLSLNSAILSFLLPLAACAHGAGHHHHHHDLHNHEKLPIANRRRLDGKADECGTPPISPEAEALFQGIIAKNKEDPESATNRRLKGESSGFSATIPTRFVVCDDGTQRISDAQIQAQMAVLNQGFEQAGFQFELIGVKRVFDPVIFSADGGNDDSNSLLQADVKNHRMGCSDTLNVFFATLPGFFGFTYLPSFANNINDYDFVAIAWDAITGGPNADGTQGTTLIHEVRKTFFLQGRPTHRPFVICNSPLHLYLPRSVIGSILNTCECGDLLLVD